MSDLTDQETQRCREAFRQFDQDNNGSIDVWELSLALEASLRTKPTQEEVFQMISMVDDDMSGAIDFPEFLKVIQAQKNAANKREDEGDLIDAFIALGGKADKTGTISYEKLKKVIVEDFGLTVKLDEKLEQIDPEHSGELEFFDFKRLLS